MAGALMAGARMRGALAVGALTAGALLLPAPLAGQSEGAVVIHRLFPLVPLRHPRPHRLPGGPGGLGVMEMHRLSGPITLDGIGDEAA